MIYRHINVTCLQGRALSQSAPSSLAASSDVAEVAALARDAGRLGIDTEFMSEGRYRALLCLTQVGVEDPATPEELRTIMIDGLDHTVETAPLAALLAAIALSGYPPHSPIRVQASLLRTSCATSAAQCGILTSSSRCRPGILA